MKLSLLNKKLLIVEDERLMRNLLFQMLKRMGFNDVSAVDNAEEVVKTNKYWKTDLLISDVEMDGMSGLELIEVIRSEKSALSCEVPIIVLTGMSQLQILMKAAELKIQGFLTKPVSEKILREKIEEILSKSSQLEYRDPKLIINNDDTLKEREQIGSDNGNDQQSVADQDKKQDQLNETVINNVVVELHKLKAGMVLNEDIVARGHTILHAGKVIDEGHIKVLNDLIAFVEKKEIIVNMTK